MSIHPSISTEREPFLELAFVLIHLVRNYFEYKFNVLVTWSWQGVIIRRKGFEILGRHSVQTEEIMKQKKWLILFPMDNVPFVFKMPKMGLAKQKAFEYKRLCYRRATF